MKIRYDEPRDERINAHRPIWREFLVIFLFLLFAAVSTGLLYREVEREHVSAAATALMLFGQFLFLGLMATVASRWNSRISVSKPMQELRSAARKVASGDFNARVVRPRRENKFDEMDALVEDFNKMVEELSTIQMLKGDFISNVSHEIKTPLAVIRNYAQALEDESLPPEQRRMYVCTIEDSAEKLSHLVENILRLNKMEHQSIVERKQYSLTEQLRCCVLALEERFEERELELDIDLEEEISVYSDEALLEVAWNNLLTNAIKFTEPGGTVGVSAKRSDDGIVVRVWDTGCGMDEETARRVFDKFYQGDTSHAAQGNGLGLAMVWRVLELVHGSISVSSRPGEGTEFFVALPGEGMTE